MPSDPVIRVACNQALLGELHDALEALVRSKKKRRNPPVTANAPALEALIVQVGSAIMRARPQLTLEAPDAGSGG